MNQKTELPQFKTFKGEWINNGKQIFHLQINRINKLNAMDGDFFNEIQDAFCFLSKQSDLRCVILTANGKHFSVGLDLNYAQENFASLESSDDAARRAIKLYETIKQLQKSIDSLEQCKVPVLVGIHGFCIGGGIDLITSGDIRYCTQDSKFSIKEIDIAIAADIGTLQRFPAKCSNDSKLRELLMTGRFFEAKEAQEIGLVSKVFENKQKMDQELINLATIISQKSPVAIWSIKKVLTHDLQRQISNNLNYIAILNASMAQTQDLGEAVRSSLTKQTPQFPKL